MNSILTSVPGDKSSYLALTRFGPDILKPFHAYKYGRKNIRYSLFINYVHVTDI